VEQILPNALYQVVADNGVRIKAGLELAARRHLLRLLVGDRVKVRVATLDGVRGQIIDRL